MELVITRGNDSPMASGRQEVLQRSTMSGGGLSCRVMFDPSVKADSTSDPVFWIHNGIDNTTDGVECDFKNHIIWMNGAAAGSQHKTKFLHARFGDGITLMVDMVPK